MKLRDGRVVTSFARGRFTLLEPKTGKSVERTFQYAGNGDHIFMVGVGPSNCVYGSTALPLEVFRYSPAAKRSEHLGAMPGGEVYSMLEHEQKLYLCYYGGAVMNLYDPAKPFWKFGVGNDANPITFGGVGDGHLRPRAMIYGPIYRSGTGSGALRVCLARGCGLFRVECRTLALPFSRAWLHGGLAGGNGCGRLDPNRHELLGLSQRSSQASS
jgi:hypothetical protein